MEAATGNLRELLDQASMGELPPQLLRVVLLAEARTFAHEALGDALAADHRAATPEEIAEARAVLAGEGAVPVLPQAAWSAAFEEPGVRRRFASLGERVRTNACREATVPLLRGGLAVPAIPAALFRSELTVPVTVAGLADDDLDGDVKERCFFQLALSTIADLPLPARGALWSYLWDRPDPAPGIPVWRLLGDRGEPAAVAGALLEPGMSLDKLAPREATARALARVVNRTDPWLEAHWDRAEYEGEERTPIGPRIWKAALGVIADSALAWGGASTAIDALRRALADAEPSDRLSIAVALGHLGDDAALPVLLPALSSEAVDEATLEAIAALGPRARAAIPVLESLSRSRTGSFRVLPLLALTRILPDVPAYSEELAREMGSAEFLRVLRDRQDLFLEGLISADELAMHWLRPTVLALRAWAHAGPPSSAVRELRRRLRANLSPDIAWARHTALAPLSSALGALGG